MITIVFGSRSNNSNNTSHIGPSFVGHVLCRIGPGLRTQINESVHPVPLLITFLYPLLHLLHCAYTIVA